MTPRDIIKTIAHKTRIIVIRDWLREEYFCLLTRISPTLNTKARYKQRFGRSIDLKNPQTLNEKLLKWKLQCFETDPLVRQCADKYAVRSYIEGKGCGDILVPLIAAYDNVEEIDWDKLPQSFAMKWNFGCGFNIICPDKSRLDISGTLRKMNRWKNTQYYLSNSEMQYKNVPKKIIVEQYLRPANGLLPDDYKVYCFHGRPMYIMVCVGREDGGHPKFYFMDADWNLARINRDSQQAPEGFTLPRPSCLDSLLSHAGRLSEPFPFVRADFYIVDNHVYFGELTFSPAAALDNRRLPETDMMFGRLM